MVAKAKSTTTDETAPNLIRDKDVAALLGIPVSTVRAQACRGQLPCVRLSPRTTRYYRHEIIEHINGQRQPVGVKLVLTKPVEAKPGTVAK